MAQIIQKLNTQTGKSQISPWTYFFCIPLGRRYSQGQLSKGQNRNRENYIISLALTTTITLGYSIVGSAAPTVSVDKRCNQKGKISDRLCPKPHLKGTRTQLIPTNTLTSTVFGRLYRQNQTIGRYTNQINSDKYPFLSDFQASDIILCKHGEISDQKPCISLPWKISQVDTQPVSQSNPEQNNAQHNDPPPVEGQPSLPTSEPTEASPLTEPASPEEDKIERLRRSLRKKKPTTRRELGDLLLIKIDGGSPPLEQPSPPPEKKPVVKPRKPTPGGYLIGNVGYFATNNIFSSEVDPIEDSLFYSGLTLASGSLPLGKNTTLNGSIDGYLIRYINQSEFDYNQIRFNLNLYQKLTPQMYAGIGWTHQNLFYARDGSFFSAGDRFLSENSLRFSFSRRDSITRKLKLDSIYQFRYSFADPDSRNRVINSLWLSMNYYWQKPLQVGLNYQFNFSDFTRRDREDYYHRLYGHLNYSISKTSKISLQSGFAVGGSTEDRIDFDGWFFSVNYNLELGRF